jgi:thiol:disulfide interchange protein
MRKRPAFTSQTLLLLSAACCAAAGAGAPTAAESRPAKIRLAGIYDQYSDARVQPARTGADFGLAVIFEGTSDLHFYAKSDTAPAPGFELKAGARSDTLTFAQARFPDWHIFTDSIGSKVEVYSGHFAVFLPITPAPNAALTGKAEVDVTISGIACTSTACLPPFEKTVRIAIDLSQSASWPQITLESHTPQKAKSIWLALPLAFLAGLILNLMPCVWPVLPLIVMQIVRQAEQARAKPNRTGLVFCLGILLFFACLAGANIILKLFYHTVLQWGDQFRNPVFLTAMALLLIVLALSMFGVLTISLPASIMRRTGPHKGLAGSVATGFLAAILSTPCGFGILAAAFAWAQAQHWLLATLTIMIIGAGMATPYAILISMPALVKRLPKPGRWMELFKQGVGFVLLIIAVKFISALPETRKADVLYFAVIFAACIWIWKGWTDLTTKPLRRTIVRILAVVIALAAGWSFLVPPAEGLIDWRDFDNAAIENAGAENRPVLIKFTADWCLSCQAADRLVYSRKDIAALITEKNVLPIKADTTRKTDTATAILPGAKNPFGCTVSFSTKT